MNVLKTSSKQLRLLGYSFVFRQPPCRWQEPTRRSFIAARHLQARRKPRQFDEYHSDDKFDVNLQEEEVRGSDRKRRRISEEDVEDELQDDTELDDEIMDLEKSINSFKIPDEMSDDLKRSMFSEEDLARMEDLGTIDDTALHPHRIIPQQAIPRQAQLHLNKLNEALDKAVAEKGAQTPTQPDVWRWYERCKINVPGFSRMIPKQGWDLLWEAQGADIPENPDRLPHLAELAEDKKKAGWELSEEEKFTEIEGLFMEGEQRDALRLFEEALGGEDRSNPTLVEMGVRMYAHHGNPERAHKLLDRLFELDRSADPRILTTLISAYADRRNEESIFTAWALYQDLQRRLTSDMQMPEYDAVVLSFLNAGHKDFALAVFRDMMLRGEDERRAASQSAFSRLSSFIDLTRHPQETNDFSLNAIKYLPRRFQNKWFYASWLRKLISEGQVNAAAQVTELMYERGVRPDAKHMNGIIAAWLRDQRTHPQQRAEELGWSMIQKRLDLVQDRRHALKAPQSTEIMEAPKVPVHVNDGAQVRVPINVSRPVPPATIETFCILLQYYLRRGLYIHIRHLRNLLAPTELQMNAFFMNHLLYAELRTRGHREAWLRFQALSEHVKPDLETWTCLWDCEKNHVHDVRNLDYTGFPMPRELFRRMMHWLQGLEGQARMHAMQDVDEDFYHAIVRAFGLSHDIEGCFVAIHTLNANFRITPTEPIVRTLLNTLTKLLPPSLAQQDKQRFPRRQRRSKKHGVDRERNMAMATYLLDTVRKERLLAIAGEGVEFEDLSEEARLEENHKVCLAMLVRVIEERQSGGRDRKTLNDAIVAINDAVQECGVDKINVRQALEVSTS